MGLLKKLMFEPGMVTDVTELAAKPRWTEGDKIRFFRKLPQKLGGWVKLVQGQFTGKCRGLFAWADNSSTVYAAIGTHNKLQVLAGGSIANITPITSSGSLTDPFTTTVGSATVTVTHTAHGRAVNDWVTFSGASAVGGITLDGDYEVKSVPDANSYTVEHSAAATSSASGGGTVNYEYEISAGLADASEGSGYGVGTYGSGTYGTARSTFIILHPRIWWIDAWGEDLLANPSEGNLYFWQRNTASRAALVAAAPTGNTGMFVTEERHVVVFGAGGNKMKVQWCDQEDHTNWTVSDLTTAGSRPLTGGTELLAGMRVRGTNLLLSDAAAFTMKFLGPPDTFGFDTASGQSGGVIGPHAAVEIDGLGFWMGFSDLFYFDGIVRRIPNTDDIRQSVFGNLNRNQRKKIVCGANTLFNEIWWLYVSATATEIDRYLKYNYKDRAWDTGTLNRTAMIDRNVFSNPIMAGDDGYLYKHESGVDADGAAMESYIVSSPIDISDGDRAVEVMGLIPDLHSLTGALSFYLLTREYPHEAEESEFFGKARSQGGKLDGRASGRQARIKAISNAVGDNWGLGVIRLDIKPGGRR